MNKRKIMIAFGTRPEAIKMCPLVNTLKKRENAVIEVCFTCQHRELLSDAARAFGVRADYEFDIMKRGQSVASTVSRILCEGEKLLCEVRPDILLVHGDTATAYAMATAAFFSGIRVGHIEAGLRSGNMYAPFPEEYNRRAISLVSSVHFAPTRAAADNLIEEGVQSFRVHITGNTVMDAFRFTLGEHYAHPLLSKCEGKRIIFMTAHRRESHGEVLEGMFRAVAKICKSFDDVAVIFPVHPSPIVKAAAKKVLGGCERVLMCEPLGVKDCHNIMARSYLILTDSGGLQEEAAALHKPVLVMRNVTERREGILLGIARLAGTDERQIFASACRVLSDRAEYESMIKSENPYGESGACEKIADLLCR